MFNTYHGKPAIETRRTVHAGRIFPYASSTSTTPSRIGTKKDFVHNPPSIDSARMYKYRDCSVFKKRTTPTNAQHASGAARASFDIRAIAGYSPGNRTIRARVISRSAWLLNTLFARTNAAGIMKEAIRTDHNRRASKVWTNDE